MDAWLKTHVALLFPALAPALFAAGVDNYRLARTRDLLVLTVRGIREAFHVLRALDYPITPAKYRYLFTLVPEPLLVLGLQQLLQNELMETAMVKHAEAARDEVIHLTEEFMVLARRSGVPTPTIDRLQAYREPGATPTPEGSKKIPMQWGGVVLLAGVVAATVTALATAAAWMIKRGRRNKGSGTRE
jgi:2-dehydropantoate 2-reductase